MIPTFELHHGDSLEVLRTIPAESVDSIVTDPPYGLSEHKPDDVVACLTAWLSGEEYKPKKKGFMGHSWDGWVPGPEIWRECFRVLKPGAHMFVFAGTRSMDLMCMAIRLAGFEMRDGIGHAHDGGDQSQAPLMAWVYGSGFPKAEMWSQEKADRGDQESTDMIAAGFEGWARGSVLKPAWEPIIMARKPLVGTVADNVKAYGTGAVNIDACRVPITSADDGRQFDFNHNGCNRSKVPDGGKLGMHDGGWKVRKGDVLVPEGRWPANVIHDGSDVVLNAFPDAAGQQGCVSGNEPTKNGFSGAVKFGGMLGRIASAQPRNDTGSASRFFYCAKASKQDRDEGLDRFEKLSGGLVSNTSGQHMTRRDEGYQVSPRANNHPTVKPSDLGLYLQTLITPPGGKTMDIFMGSGSFGKSAMKGGFNFIGIEGEKENVDISRARIQHAQPRQMGLELA